MEIPVRRVELSLHICKGLPPTICNLRSRFVHISKSGESWASALSGILDEPHRPFIASVTRNVQLSRNAYGVGTSERGRIDSITWFSPTTPPSDDPTLLVTRSC